MGKLGLCSISGKPPPGPTSCLRVIHSELKQSDDSGTWLPGLVPASVQKLARDLRLQGGDCSLRGVGNGLQFAEIGSRMVIQQHTQAR